MWQPNPSIDLPKLKKNFFRDTNIGKLVLQYTVSPSTLYINL